MSVDIALYSQGGTYATATRLKRPKRQPADCIYT